MGLSQDAFPYPEPPPNKEGALSPCQQLLVGARYALIRAEQLHYPESGDEYDPFKLAKETEAFGIEGTAGGDSQAWMAGFYFNAGLQRIAWVAERVLAVFTFLPEKKTVIEEYPRLRGLCRTPRIRKLRVEAEQRLESLRKRKVAIEPIRKAFEPILQDSKVDLVKDPVLENNCLQVIRQRVNSQKHAGLGLTHYELNPKATTPVENSWLALRYRQRFDFAGVAYRRTCDMYSRVLDLCKRGILWPPPEIKRRAREPLTEW